MKKAKEETQSLDAELKKHRDKVISLRESTKKEILDLESNLEEARMQIVRCFCVVLRKYALWFYFVLDEASFCCYDVFIPPTILQASFKS